MKEYVIFYNRANIMVSNLEKKTFETFEDAVKFANTLHFGVTIYESVAQTKINHELIKINENIDVTTSKPTDVS